MRVDQVLSPSQEDTNLGVIRDLLFHNPFPVVMELLGRLNTPNSRNRPYDLLLLRQDRGNRDEPPLD